MSKTTGLGDNFYYGGYNLSGDTNSLQNIHGGHTPWDSTGIDKSAYERLALLRDGGIQWTSYFNPSAAQAHVGLSSLLRTDRVGTYCRGTAIGNAAACLVSKQINYDPTRAADGGLTIDVQAVANGYGLVWGKQLTAGLRTDTGVVNGAALLDTAAVTGFGAQAFLQVTAFSGTDVTIAVQDSDDNVSFANVTGLVFTTMNVGNPAPFAQRLATTNTATVKKYTRAVTTTSGGFTSVTFNVVIVKNPIAGVVF